MDSPAAPHPPPAPPPFLMDVAHETWKIVPGFNGELWASSIGRVLQYVQRGQKWYQPTFGTTIRHGYPTLVHNKKIRRVHVLVTTAFHGPRPTAEHTPDHIAKYDGDWQKERSDNRAVNLKWATKQQQAQNKKRPAPSVHVYQQGPLLWMPDEEFRNSSVGIMVSQYGRAWSKAKSHPYTPTASQGQDYATIGGATGRRNSFHIVVALAFPEISGERPNDPNATVDHIDRDKSNNHASNLRWATKSQQALNQTRSDASEILATLKIPVECKGPSESTWTSYESLSEASQMSGVHHNTIRQALEKNPDGYIIKIRKNAGWCFRVKKERTDADEHFVPSTRMLVDCKAPGTDEWVAYESYKSASRGTGVHCNTIRTATKQNPSGYTITMKCKARGWSFRMH